MSMRAGTYVRQPEGYSAFLPVPLPPKPPLDLDPELTRLLSEADRALGRLDGAASILPNADLFVAMYVRQEAVLSSQIEGTQSTLEDVLEFELDEEGKSVPKDVAEVVNYVRAMEHGLKRLKDLPLSLRLIREIHVELLKGARGGHRTPGEFRRSQNWIGPAGSTITTATFVPPPPHEMTKALSDFEKFLHDQTLPILVHCGLAHAQFETIHPFLDGNGRVGRLLITFLLCEREVLRSPLLYLSHFFKAHRAEYYDRLMAVRTDGKWEEWIKFFLRGVSEVAEAATDTSRAILALREKHRKLIADRIGGTGKGQLLLDHLYQQPLVTVRLVEQQLKCSYGTAEQLVEQFEKQGMLKEITGWKRNRRYRYDPYLKLFEQLGSGRSSQAPPETTGSAGGNS